MSLITLISQIVLTVPLTIILNFFKNKEHRMINHLLIPSIYIVIISALIPSVSSNIFLIVVFEIFIRNFYVTNIVNQENDISKGAFLIECILTIGLSLFTYNYFISKVNTVIPDPEEIKGFIWFLIILYIAGLYNMTTKDKAFKAKAKKKTLKNEKVIMQYARFKNLYFDSIRSKSEVINNLVYAIMINEEYKNPTTYRKLKENVNAILRREYTYGIMQEKSPYRVSDRVSIDNAVKNFEKTLKNTILKEKEQLDKLLTSYNEEDKTNILNIYNIIVEFNKK